MGWRPALRGRGRGASVTAGSELDRRARLRLVRAAEARYGLERGSKDIDLAGAVYAGGGEIDLAPAWFDMPGSASAESERRAARARRTGRGNSATFALLESFARASCEPPMYVFRGAYLAGRRSERRHQE